MKHKIYIFIFSLVLMLSLGSFVQVSACSCVRNVPCQDYQRANVIFVGKILGKEEVTSFEYKHKFEIIEAFKGVEVGKKIEILAGIGEGTCGYIFNTGETYLVFAGESTSLTKIKGFWTGSCSGNRPIKYAEDLLNYLRNDAGEETKIAGSVLEWTRFDKYKLTSVKIKAQEVGGAKRDYYGLTDKNGDYEIKVPAGKYKVTPELPKGYIFGERRSRGEEFVEVAKQRCEARFFTVANDSEISGRLLNYEGEPLKNIDVELIPTYFDISNLDHRNNVKEIERTDKNGVFSFKYVPVGNYLLSINYAFSFFVKNPFPTYFYPQSTSFEQAQVIEIGSATKINVTFQIPTKTKIQKIHGTVFGNGNIPISGAEVFIKDVDLNDWKNYSGIKTDAAGDFILEGFEGRKYRILVKFTQKIDGVLKGVDVNTENFTLDDKTQKFRIVLPINIENKK